MSRKLLRAFHRLAESWWRSDRIRVSPMEGALLRLGPGDWLVHSGRVYQVRSRTVVEHPERISLRLDCDGGETTLAFDIQLSASGAIERIECRSAGFAKSTSLAEFDIWSDHRIS